MSKFYREVLSKSQYIPEPAALGERRPLPKPPSIEELRQKQPIINKLPEVSTVDRSTPATVDRSTHVHSPVASAKAIWITENGEPIAAGRVSQIGKAQDALNACEESVYDFLWFHKDARIQDDASRLITVGYDAIGRGKHSQSGPHWLSKRTVQRAIASLIDKDFLEVAIPADIYSRTCTTYRLFPYATVKQTYLTKGRTHVAKLGCGFSFVRELDLSTVDRSRPVTVDKLAIVTVDRSRPVTVDKLATPSLLGQKEQSGQKGQSSSVALVRTELSTALRQQVDDDGARWLLAECRKHSPDITDDEIVEAIRNRAQDSVSRKNRVYFMRCVANYCKPECLSARRKERQGREEPQDYPEPFDSAAWDAQMADVLPDWRKNRG